MRAVAGEIAANRQVDRASPHFSNYRAMARIGKQMRREQRLRNGMARVPEDLANGLSVCLLAPPPSQQVESNQSPFGNPASDSGQEPTCSSQSGGGGGCFGFGPKARAVSR